MPHPEPPADLAQRPLPIWTTRGSWFRIHSLAHEPVFFGRTGDNRFDAPAGEYGVLYVGKDAYCAFIETFGHATGINVVTTAALAGRGLARIEVARPLRLVDLTGAGLSHLGADERLCTGDDYALSQRWSLALRQHPLGPDGLYYCSRHDPERLSAAIFDSAASAMTPVRLGSLADPAQRGLLRRLLATYRFELVEQSY